MDPKAIADYLRRTELFATVPDNVIGQVAQGFTPETFAERTVLFDQGDPGEKLYIICKGSVELRRRDVFTGVEMFLYMYGAGKSLGEELVLNDDPAPFYAMTWDAVNALVMPKDLFRRVVNKVPQVGLAASQILARRASRLFGEKGVRFVSLAKLNVDPEAFKVFPEPLIREHRIIPINRRGRILTVAMADPHDLLAFDAAKRHLKDGDLEIVGISNSDFDKALDRIRTTRSGTDTSRSQTNLLEQLRYREQPIRFIPFSGRTQDTEDRGTGSIASEQVNQLLNRMVGEAVQTDASDIHIEPGEEHLVLRYRIDGQLLQHPEKHPIRIHAALVSRLKAIASMDITERRKPQDGRLGVRVGHLDIALRISTLPTPWGEKVVLRILNAANALISLDRIVTVPAVRERMRELIFQPYGIVLVTGPTGSGKTTTMYSSILERKEEGVNIVTIEDPIEYVIPGITQVQYNEAANLGYAEAIRAFLRQDPDIMLVGETRDARTAHHAMQAALSGHLVFTSLHTNSALGTIARLTELGVEAPLVAQALSGVISQRLVRQICPHCRTEHKWDSALLKRIYDPGTPIPRLYKGAGCNKCNGSGYSGRVAALEVFRPTEEVRHLIASRAPMRELRDAATTGMITLRDYGLHLLSHGMTTPHEVLRVLFTDEESEASVETHVRCTQCGARNNAANRFCEECGASLQTAS
ncbi:MAG: type II secretion system protein GspE [Deltaproteobacteria bacterium]|nr:MAG: type II secretion system protein GspE [Deltaproteobacteria bacterium]